MLLGRSSFYYRSRRKKHVALKMRLKGLVMVRVRFGYPRLTLLLKREGWPVGKKLVYRRYREWPEDAHQEAAQASQRPARSGSRAIKRIKKW
jgi:putative transposase